MTQQEMETPYEIGARVMCSDGDGGRLHRVIIDPAGKALRHLVIGRDEHTARLVPVNLVAAAAQSGITLICSVGDLDRLEPAEATEVVQTPPMHTAPSGAGALGSYSPKQRTETVTYDRVPLGEVQIRGGDRAHAADGDVGRFQGLVVDADDHVTHVLLTEGRLWSKKEVAVPIRHVVDTSFGVQLDLTKGEVKDLPAVDLARMG